GKRKKSSRKPQTARKREPLPTVFSCLFCNHEKSVICRIDKKLKLGYLNCKVCGQNFQMSTNPLTVPVDIYSEWIDACENGEITTKNEDDNNFGSAGSGDEDDDYGNERRVDDEEEEEVEEVEEDLEEEQLHYR
ncbi:transcription elongation factor Elf1 like-domain-containing protein, partial [Dipodascopsis uninucleata]